MNTAEQIIAIILSSFLAIFLILAIALTILVIRLVRKMNSVADTASEIIDKAHDIADKVENVSDMFKKTAGPVALGRYFMNIAEMVTKHKQGKK